MHCFRHKTRKPSFQEVRIRNPSHCPLPRPPAPGIEQRGFARLGADGRAARHALAPTTPVTSPPDTALPETALARAMHYVPHRASLTLDYSLQRASSVSHDQRPSRPCQPSSGTAWLCTDELR
eukprot:SM000060S19659  [mRNA]  locus=s60:367601:367983:- [translate_table: standard]